MAESATTCGQVTSTLSPCIAYVRSGGGAVPPPCCGGIRTLNSQAKATPERQAACRCIKSVVQTIPSLNPAILSALPANCGVNLPYKISLSIDCSKIQ